MKTFNFKSCIEEGLLRKIPPSKDKAEGSIKTSDKWLDESKRTLEVAAYNSSVMASYNAMFHAARAILFYDGMREKSHACISKHLEENHVKPGRLELSWVELLDHHRELRHNDQYSITNFITEEEAREANMSAMRFTKRMNILLEKLEKEKPTR